MTEGIIRDDKQLKKFEAVAKMLEAFSAHDAEYIVQDVYLDFGQDWMWTTICRRGYRECQVLCPRDWQKIVEAQTPSELAEVVDLIRNGEYFGDR